MISQRIPYIDIARAIAIITVIAYHTGYLPLQHIVLPLITPWMLPIFAVLHGMLYEERAQTGTFLDVIVGRVRSLLIPYILYGTASFMLWLGLRWYAPHSVIFISWQEGLIQLLTGVGLVYNGPLWFLPSFFIAAILFAGMRTFLRRPTITTLLIGAHVFVYLTWISNLPSAKVVFSYDLSFLFVGCMLMGSVFVRWKKKKIPVIYWGVIGVIFVLISKENGTVDIFGRLFHHPILYWLSAIAGCFLMINLSRTIEKWNGALRNMLVTVGQSSMILFAIHWPIMQWLTFVLSLLGLVAYLEGTPTYTSFSYYHPSAMVFTLIELPLLVLYMSVPLLVLPVVDRVRRA